MRHNLFLSVIALSTLCIIGTVPGCGRDQQLESIAIQPSTETFGASDIPVSQDMGATVQLRALGTYIHPPVTKDITSQVQWLSNTPGIATVSPSGLLTATGNACGNTLVSATVITNHSTGGLSSSGALVTGYMTGTVVCFSSGTVLAVDFNGAGSGTVSSVPPGLSCAASCSGSFVTGSSVSITATANGGSSFGGWMGCDSTSGTTCTINNLTANRTVTVTFN